MNYQSLERRKDHPEEKHPNVVRMATSGKVAIYTAVGSTFTMLTAAVLVAFIMIFLNSNIISQINATLRELQELCNSTHNDSTLNDGIEYIQWGHLECPPTSGTTKVYEGFAAGTFDTNNAPTPSSLCLPVSQGDNLNDSTTSQYGDTKVYMMHGMEYNTFLPKQENRSGVACALCKVSTRNTVVVIPATNQCNTLVDSSGNSWMKEYDGYLMQASVGSDYYCVDYDMQHFQNSQQNIVMLSHVAAGNDGPQVSSHNPQRVLSCVVCTV